MAEQPRVPRSVLEKIEALDGQLFLLRDALHNLHTDHARFKTVASELRLLICMSSRTEGLLWRLTNELQVDDMVSVQSAGEEVDLNHPLAADALFMQIPLFRAGEGPPQIPVVQLSLLELTKSGSAVFVQGENITHERMIGLVANQIGLSHESDGTSYRLQMLRQILINNKPAFFAALALHAHLTLEVAERVMEKATTQLGFKRKERIGYGNLSIMLGAHLNKPLSGPAHLASFESVISHVSPTVMVDETRIVYQFTRHGTALAPIEAPIPASWRDGAHAVFCLSYSSQHERVRVIINGECFPEVGVPLGFVDVHEMPLCEASDPDLTGFASTHDRFLRPEEIREIAEGQPPFYGRLFRQADSPVPIFPEA